MKAAEEIAAALATAGDGALSHLKAVQQHIDNAIEALESSLAGDDDEGEDDPDE
jgi:hypothetical protein